MTRFDAPHGAHAWLNDQLCVATCFFRAKAVTIRACTVD